MTNGMSKTFLLSAVTAACRLARRCLPGLLLWLSLGLAQAQPVNLPAEAVSVDLSSDLTMFRDASRQLGLAEVLAGPAEFRAVSRNELTQGFDGGAFWLRTRVHNPGPASIDRWLVVGHPRLQAVTLFHPVGQGWQTVPAGTDIALAERLLPTVVAAFPLHLDAGETRTILLRVASDTSIDMAVSVWQPLAYQREQQDRQLLIVLALGGALITVFMSLFVFAITRERPYLYFALLYLSASTLETARDGLLQHYLWPASQPFPPQVIAISGACAMLSLIFLLRSFLDLGRRLPRWDQACLAIAWLALLTIPGCLVNYSLSIRVLSLAVLALFCLAQIVTIQVWRQGYLPARFMAMGYSVFWVLEGLRQLTNQGLLKLPQAMNFSLSWSLLLATPLILLALAERSRTLNRQLEIARQTSQTKSDFLARVSHELRAPLNTIIGYARMLGRGSRRLSLQEGTNDIEKNGLRLLGLIDELLDQSRLVAGRLSLTPQPVLLADWLDEVARAGKLLGEASGNQFTVDYQGDLRAAVVVDSHRLRQVLDNLLGNACRQTSRGSICLHCRISEADGEDGEPAADRLHLSFAVSDTGRGIAAANQERIFEPFFQGDGHAGSGARPGVGLGLPISRDLVRLMGGELQCRSTLGEGSTFFFSISCPLAPQARVAAAVPVASPLGGRRVLVVEDRESDRRILEEMLLSLGYRVGLAEGVTAAIAALSEAGGGWEALLTDQVMPDGSGWQVLHYARTHLPGLPVLLVSSEPAAPPADLVADCVFDAILYKPVASGELAGILNTVLAGRPAPTEPAAAVPDADSRQVLQVLIDGGRITDIEDWASRQAQQPQFAAYAAAVTKAAQQLDFATLQQLAAG